MTWSPTTPAPALDNVIGYLRGHGWAMTGRWRSAEIWSIRDFDVLVPARGPLADTTTRLYELVSCVADAEERSPSEIWHEMSEPARDVVSYRPSVDPAGITIRSGAHTVVALRDLIAICARHVAETDTAARPDAVDTLLRQALLSVPHPSPGLDVAFPVPATDADYSLGRRTVLRLLASSVTAQQVSDPPPPEASTRSAARADLSEPEYLAFAALAGSDRTAPFVLNFRWSWLSPRLPASVTFGDGAGERLVRAIGTESDRPPESRSVDTAQGVIIGLSDDQDGRRRRITIRGILQHDNGSRTRRRRLLTARLEADADYAAALVAHREGRVVTVTGTVDRSTSPPEITVDSGGLTITDRLRP